MLNEGRLLGGWTQDRARLRRVLKLAKEWRTEHHEAEVRWSAAVDEAIDLNIKLASAFNWELDGEPYPDAIKRVIKERDEARQFYGYAMARNVDIEKQAKDARREALEEACGLMCWDCSGGAAVRREAERHPMLTKLRWVHPFINPTDGKECAGLCDANDIRDLMEQDNEV